MATGGKCRVEEKNGHTIVFQEKIGLFGDTTCIFEVKGMTDVTLKVEINCGLDGVTNLSWTNDMVSVYFDTEPFLSGSSHESVDVYFSD